MPTTHRALFSLLVLAAPAAAQSVTRISVGPAGVEGNFGSGRPSVSATGLEVTFESEATNLVAGDTNGVVDVFLHDRTTSITRLVSVDALGAIGLGESMNGRISADGRYVAFETWSNNWDPTDQNGWLDIYVKDLATGALERVSLDSAGLEGNHVSQDAAISGDGRFVAFMSRARLALGDVNLFLPDVYVRDRMTGTTELVSIDSLGAQGIGVSRQPAISGDGRYVVFESHSALSQSDTNGLDDVYIRDRLTGTTTLVSIEVQLGVGNDRSFGPVISGDGRFVAFESDATNMDFTGDTNGVRDVYLVDLNVGVPTRVSVGPGFVESNGLSQRPAIGFDGRFVAFESDASNLVAGDVDLFTDVFVFDTLNTTTHRVSVTSVDVAGNEFSTYPAISALGSVVAFSSLSSRFDPADTGLAEDVFVRDGLPLFSAYCFGDGSGAPCPCGNTSSPGDGRGCLNSLGSSGRLVASGVPSTSSDTLVLAASGMPNASALYVQGMLVENGGAGSVLNDGLLCLAGPLVRLRAKTNAAGASSYPGIGDPSISVLGGTLAGHTRNYQVFYRNAAAFCAPGTANTTNAVQLTWTP